jgi:hypothetical protein
MPNYLHDALALEETPLILEVICFQIIDMTNDKCYI